MAFDGYLEYGGTELINAARTTAYVRNRLPGFPLVRRTDAYDNLGDALLHEPYRSPYLDDADWVETDMTQNPDSDLNPTHGFFGLYPLAIQGLGSSTTSAPTIESIQGGGTVLAERAASRSIRVRGLLIGDGELAVEAGLTWLRNVLRSRGCSMHGDDCGYQDLRYFLAPPRVCNPLWSTQLGTGRDEHFATNAETAPEIRSNGEPIDRPLRTQWVMPKREGVIVSWGALAIDGDDVIEEHGPVYLRRTNYLINPSFRENTDGWFEALDDQPAGQPVRYFGSDRTFATVGEGIEHVRTNWLPDPSFENGEPSGNGWRSNSTLVAVAGAAADGTHYARVAATPGNENYIEANLLGPYDSQNAWARFSIAQSTTPVKLQLFDNYGKLVEEKVIPIEDLAADWNSFEVELEFKVKRDFVFRIASTLGSEIDVDRVAITTLSVPFFTGDYSDGDGYFYEFPEGSAGPSRRRFPLGAQNVRAQTGPTDMPNLPAVFQFKMRAPETEPNVLVELIDLNGVAQASAILQPGREWETFNIFAHFGARLRPRFTSTQRFDLDELTLEPGSTFPPFFFDGNSVLDAETYEDYTLKWLGKPNNSPSQLTWDGDTVINLRQNYRAYLHVHQGAISGTFESTLMDEVPMDLQLRPYDRTLHRVKPTVNVHEIRSYSLSVGAAREVDFVLTAEVAHVYATGSVLVWEGEPTDAGQGREIFDPPLNVPVVDVLRDPDLPVLAVPPKAPVVPDIAIQNIGHWKRYYVEIPAVEVSLWSDAVPTIKLISDPGVSFRQVRVRFHPNPFEWAITRVDPKSYCGEFLLSYLPANSTLVVDGVAEDAWVSVAGGQTLAARQLLYGTGGKPMEWPELTCGIGYVMTIDVPWVSTPTGLAIEASVTLRE